MNKNLKRIVAIALVFGTISAVAPVMNVNLLTTKVYAKAKSTNDKDTLNRLNLTTSKGSEIKLYSTSSYHSNDEVESKEVSDNVTYYAKTSDSTISISAGGPSSKYVKVFKGTSKSTKGKSPNDDVSLSSGSNTLTVRVYSEDPESDITYDDSFASEYIIKVNCTATGSGDSDSSDSDSSSESYGDIYLSKLSVSAGDLSFVKDKSTYDLNVGMDVSEITIKATPEDTSYKVKIGDKTVDDTDKYKNTVSLDTGKNTILVEIEDDSDNYRAYTLNITRKSTSSTETSTSTETTETTQTTETKKTETATPEPDATETNVAAKTVICDRWIQVNGGWQYNDKLGNPLKNQWFFDKNPEKWYYLGVDGFMVSNTTIGDYKIGADGAWIK